MVKYVTLVDVFFSYSNIQHIFIIEQINDWYRTYLVKSFHCKHDLYHTKEFASFDNS